MLRKVKGGIVVLANLLPSLLLVEGDEALPCKRIARFDFGSNIIGVLCFFVLLLFL